MSDGSEGDADSEQDDSASDDSETREERRARRQADKRIGVAARQGHMSKTIAKARKQTGRFKANGNRKNKEWIMKKKDRMRRQGATVKADSKYSGRKRPRSFN